MSTYEESVILRQMDGKPVRSNDEWPDDIPFVVEEVPIETPMTDSEKLEYIYQIALKTDQTLKELAPQIAPMIEGISKNPMLKMFLR
jgi:hypothetical protein